MRKTYIVGANGEYNCGYLWGGAKYTKYLDTAQRRSRLLIAISLFFSPVNLRQNRLTCSTCPSNKEKSSYDNLILMQYVFGLLVSVRTSQYVL